jgi:hypothetical protein
MTIAILIAIGLSLTVWTAFRRWWHRSESNLGIMSQGWISEQRSHESHHRLT